MSFLMPHEPDLGFGRPGAQVASVAAAAPTGISALIQSGTAQAACGGHAAACAGGLSVLDGLQSMAIRSMDQVKADIDAHRARVR
ncbi:MAG: hypothetical protein WDM81_13365 [Rhizomicrobium sp.]